jgi:hypothetical protein
VKTLQQTINIISPGMPSILYYIPAIIPVIGCYKFTAFKMASLSEFAVLKHHIATPSVFATGLESIS